MFPFQQSDDLVPQISFNPHQEDITQQDLVALEQNYDYLPMNMGGGQPNNTIISTAPDHNNDQPSTTCDNNERKIMRRENERQRRQQMTFLTSSLRSLLPLEMIKGKRSVCDHMHEAVNYINHMKTKIEALIVMRDELKSRSDYSSAQATDHESGSSDTDYLNSVIVRPCWGGIEIVISVRFPLSRVLEVLNKEGLNIAGCSSTKVNGTLIHTIQCEVRSLCINS
ncbi:Achaete-scute transcription factor-related [Trema orientale]|uniref:Achaete-scute transcription factor-related n=1 Tax=Trema orientale TaxID=63057 RepID=A0A2P5ERA6_TREOI|nr:Achaete-scute transcription factor-related [Trema orientale]